MRTNLELVVYEMRRGKSLLFAPPGYGVPDCEELQRIRIDRYTVKAGRLLPDVRR